MHLPHALHRADGPRHADSLPYVLVEIAPNRLLHPGTGQALVERLEVARTAWSRFVGLMGRHDLPAGSGLLIEPCNSIHMFFMRFPIDVLFLDRDRRVKRVMLRLKPWRVSPVVFGAKSVVELPAGTLLDRTLEGELLAFE